MNGSESQDEVFMRHWTAAAPAVSVFVHSLVPDFHTAQDILQDVSVTLFRKFAEYDPSRPFVAWAIGMAKYRILAEKRDAARSPISVHSDLVESLGQVAEEMQPELDQARSVLRNCLEGLPERSMQVLRLRYVELLKPGAIAKQEGIKPGALRTMLFRIRRLLERCIETQLATTEP